MPYGTGEPSHRYADEDDSDQHYAAYRAARTSGQSHDQAEASAQQSDAARGSARQNR